MDDVKALKERFEEDGFLIIPQFLEGVEFAEVCENLDRYIREIVPTLAPEHAFYQDRSKPETLKQLHYMGRDAYFEAYRTTPKWVDLAESLLGEPVEAGEPEWFNKPPNTVHVTPPHQDNYYFNLVPANVLTIWVALDPIDEENGCLRFVRGSHKDGVRPHSRSSILGFSQHIADYDDLKADEVVVKLNPGDASVHHANTIHRADANVSTERNRRAFAMVMRGGSCEIDEEALARHTALAEQHVKELSSE
jgi:phytanoyl-CoA hydroxylase